MKNLMKNTVKFALGSCFTLGAVTVAASVLAGKNVGKIVSAGFNGAKTAVQEELAAMEKSDEAVAVTVSEEELTSAVNSEN